MRPNGFSMAFKALAYGTLLSCSAAGLLIFATAKWLDAYTPHEFALGIKFVPLSFSPSSPNEECTRQEEGSQHVVCKVASQAL